jgi:hypothetical protein
MPSVNKRLQDSEYSRESCNKSIIRTGNATYLAFYSQKAIPSHLQMLQSMAKAGRQSVNQGTKAIATAKANVPGAAS